MVPLPVYVGRKVGPTERGGDGLADDEGFREFVHARLARLSRVAYLLTGEHHAAADLLQNTLVRLASRWQGSLTRSARP